MAKNPNDPNTRVAAPADPYAGMTLDNMDSYSQRLAPKVNQVGGSGGPYRSGLQTNFDSLVNAGAQGRDYQSYSNDQDADVRQAQEMQNQLDEATHGMKPGLDQAATGAQLDAIKARIGQKNALGEKIGSSDTQEANAENDIRSTANQALGQGLQNTRENFNHRGLLYSGMRQGGEGEVRNKVAGQMAEGLAGTKRDYSNSKEAAKSAYAAVDFAHAKERYDMANQTFDMVTKNNVARMQAMEQLGEGTGRLAMTFAGSGNNRPQNASSQVGSNDYQFLGTGARDGFGGEQMSSGNPGYDYGRRTT